MRIHRYPQQRKKLRFFRVFCAAFGVFLLSVIGWSFFSSTSSGPAGTSEAHILSAKESALPKSILERIAPLPFDVEYPEGTLTEKQRFDRLVLKKSERRLYAYTEKKLVRVYSVALGRQPTGAKMVNGDGKTPEGIYAIKEKAEKSPYYKSLAISYPNAEDLLKATEYGVDPGGNISIHGIGDQYSFLGIEHRASDWTHGSVAVSNEEIDELFRHTLPGTPVELLP